MRDISLFNDTNEGNTSVSNLFIDEYLADANDAQIKVYLYLLRMTEARKATSISDMADKFNHTEKDVCRALKYWEKKGLLALAYDTLGTIVGIQVYGTNSVARPVSNTASFTPVVSMTTGPMFTTGQLPPITSLDPNYVASVSGYNVGTTSAFQIPAQGVAPSVAPVATSALSLDAPCVNASANRFEKPTYSSDELIRFKEREETAQLIFVAEQYLKRTLKPADIQSLLFITDVIGFSSDMVDYLLQYCVGKKKTSFNYIESVAIGWAEKGISTPEEARQESSAYDSNIYTVMHALGKSADPTNVEIDFIRKWRNDFGFSTEIILEACKRTVLSTDKGRFNYANKILESWKNAGVQSKDDIISQDNRHKSVAPNTNKRVSGNTAFHQFEKKTDYDYNAIENMLLKQ